jgi:hypothetical protein
MATTESANNNTITNADALELGTSLTASLTSTDVDYFKVSGDDISVDSLVTMVFTPSVLGVGKEWTIDLVNGAGTSLLGSGAQGVTAVTTLTARVQDTDGAVYLKVTPSQFSGSMDYSVLATAEKAVEAEDNDTAAKGTPLTKGVSVEGALGTTAAPDGSDVDFYVFTVAESGTVSIALSGTTSTATSNIYTASIQNAAGQTLTDDGQQIVQSFATTGTMAFAGAAGSTYFLKMIVASGEETDFNASDDGRADYTLTFSGTAVLNAVPVITVGSKSSSSRDVQVDSGVSQSVKVDSTINLSDVMTLSDADGDATIASIKVLLVDAANAGTADGGYLTINGADINPVSSANGNVYQTITLAQWATATYTAGAAADVSTPQQLYAYAVDNSGATAAVSDAGGSLAFNSRVDTGGTIYMELASVDADVLVTKGTTSVAAGSSLGSVTEGAGDASGYVDINFAYEGTLADDATVSVILTAKNTAGVAVSDLEYYVSDTLLDSNLFNLTATNDSTSPVVVRIKATDDGESDVEDLTLSFVTNSSAAGFDNLTSGFGTLAVAEQKASFVVSDPVFSAGTSLTESDTDRTATYTITANDLVVGVPLTVDVSTAGGLSLTPSTWEFEATAAAGDDEAVTSKSQTIVVSATDDTDVEVSPHSGTLTFAVSEGSNTTKYAGAVSTVSVNILDNDATGGATANVVLWTDGTSIASQAFTVSTGADADSDGKGDTTATVTSTASGQLTLTDYIAGSVEIDATIDTAANAGITITDAVLVLKSIVGLVDLTTDQTLSADVDQSGTVNISDAVSVLKIIVGLSPAQMSLLDSTGGEELDISAGLFDLTAVILGDVDGSYADII